MSGNVGPMKTTTKATATTELAGWDEHDYDTPQGRPKLAETQMRYTYRGELTADGAARGQMVYRDSDNAEFTGLERVSGRLGDRAGSFVVRIGGVYESGVVTYEWTILDGTATDDLRGLTGGGKVVWAHGQSGTLTFSYALDA